MKALSQQLIAGKFNAESLCSVSLIHDEICLFSTIPEEQPLGWKHAGLDQLRELLGCCKKVGSGGGGGVPQIIPAQ